jgi:thioredoxin-related protein
MIREMMVDNLPHPAITKDFFEVYTEFVTDRSGLVKPHTIKKYKTIQKILVDFEIQEKYTLTFESVNYEFITRFKKHLFGRKLLNDTISKYIQGVQIFMNWARERDFHKNTDLLKVKIERDKYDVIYLTDEELTSMLDKVRDMFCFLAFTGQRFF